MLGFRFRPKTWDEGDGKAIMTGRIESLDPASSYDIFVVSTDID